MNKQFSFNKIYVIESLSSSEPLTGVNLFNDLLKWKSQEIKKLQTQLIQVNSRNEFFDCIETIKNEVVNASRLPLLHFEIHGSTKKDGLVLNSGQLITWLELANRFREINILINHNLVVSFATCYGAHLYREIRPTDKAPFWGFVAPWEEVGVGDVEVSFNSFFDTLLSTLNFNEAVNKLNETNNLPYRYHFYNAEEVFEKIYDTYETVNYSPDNYNKRILGLMSKALSNINVRQTMTIPEVRRFFEDKLINAKEEYRKQYRKIFLMEE